MTSAIHPAGHVLCTLAELARTGARSVQVPSASARWPLGVVVVADGADIRAYRNRCPHQGTPLETFPDEVLDRDTRELVCSTHGARFRVSDGVCVSGPCVGARLAAIAVRVDDGRVLLADPLSH